MIRYLKRLIADIWQRWDDWQLECAISDECGHAKYFSLIKSEEAKRLYIKHTLRMAALILQRSPGQVERMERARGIYR